MSALQTQLLEFDPARHEYRVAGEIIPGVTEVLEGGGVAEPYTGDAWYGDRGTAIHAATALYERGDLDHDSMDPQIEPYLAAYSRFLGESGFKSEVIEDRAYNPALRFAGTVDRIGILNGKRITLEIKSGQPRPWHPVQVAAYCNLTPEHPKRGKLLYLRGDGLYELMASKDERADWQVFQAALAIYRWKSSKGAR